MIDRPAAGRAARVPGGGRSLVAPLWSVVLLAGCGAILTGCDSRQDAPEPQPSAVADGPAQANPAAAAQCLACHKTDAAAGIGPGLKGVYGAKAGSRPGFAYSTPLQGSGIVWTGATLDRWLASPQAMVPGTRMTFPGLADAEQRRHVVGWLKQLH